VQLKVTRSGPRSYLQIVHAYRDEQTGRPKQRHIANLGRADLLGDSDLDTLINGLLKFTNRASLDELHTGITAEGTTFSPALQVGDIWAILGIWHQLKLAQTIAKAVRRGRRQIDVEKLVRVMVMNRLSDPQSKLGLLRWLEQVYLPGVDQQSVQHQHLLRAMDALLEHKQEIEDELAGTLLPLFDTEMEVVFYDITTVSVEGESELEGDVREHGKSKAFDGIDRQFAVGVVQTADGFPVTHEVFEGNISETTTVQEVVTRLAERFPVRRLVFVADRAMISLDNLSELEGIELPGGRRVEYILAVPAKRYRAMTESLPELHRRLMEQTKGSDDEAVAEAEVDGRRLVVAHSPKIARRARKLRARRVVKALAVARALAGKLNDQADGVPRRGRRLSDSGAKVTFGQELAKHKLTRLIRIETHDDIFWWDWDVKELERDLELDGKLVLISNVRDLPADQLVAQYKDLADIERGFRIMKNRLDIGPVYHRLPDRIRAHTFICFLALVIQRALRHRLHRSTIDISPEEMLYRLRAVQRHSVRLATGKQLDGLSAMTPEQRLMFDAAGVPIPTMKRLEAAM
jgi:transposase